MKTGFGNLVFQYAAYRMQPGKKNIFTRLYEDTSKELKFCYNMFSGQTKTRCQQEIARINHQISIIEKNLNNSHSLKPQYIDIIR